MNKFIFILIAFATSLHGQVTDTLFFGPKKYPIKRTRISYESYQTGPVRLPSEYEAVKNRRGLALKYKVLNDTAHCIGHDDEGNQFWVAVLDQQKSYPIEANTTYLQNLIDTIIVTKNEFLQLRPYIKAKKKKYYFCASTTIAVSNDTAVKAKHDFINDGYILSFWQDKMLWDNNEVKMLNSYFVIRDLFYLRGISTFCFDRQFIIKIR